jgi:hypothetical protein
MRLADYWHEFCARQGVREDDRDMRAVFMAGGAAAVDMIVQAANSDASEAEGELLLESIYADAEAAMRNRLDA